MQAIMKKQLFQRLDSIEYETSYRQWMLDLEQAIIEFNEQHGTQFDVIETLTEYFDNQAV